MPTARRFEAAYRTSLTDGRHGLGFRPTRADRESIDPDLLAQFNRGTARAIAANRGRVGRENYLEAMAR